LLALAINVLIERLQCPLGEVRRVEIVVAGGKATWAAFHFLVSITH
jgi:hypothetical protein